MLIPAKGKHTTEFWAAVLGALVLVGGLVLQRDAASISGACVLASYVLSRGIAKAGFGRAAHEGGRRVV